MLQLPEVTKRIFRRPLYWPYRYIAIAVLVYSTAVGFIYAMKSMEKSEVLDLLFEQNLENRRREISEIKMAAAAPYIWKPLLSCQSINFEAQRKNSVNRCVKTDLKFMPELKNKKYNFFYAEAGVIHYLEKSPKPCGICHRKNIDSFVLWTFSTDIPQKSLFFTKLTEHKNFILMHIIFVSIIVFYLLLRFLHKIWPGSFLTSAAFVFPIGHEDIIETLVKIEKKFIYLEKADNYIRGYLPRYSLARWVKKSFTPGSDSLERDISLIRASAVLLTGAKNLDFSLEGIRIAHTMALRSPSGYFMVHDKLIHKLVEKSRVKPDKRKGIWKVKNQKVVFYLLSFMKESADKENDIKHEES